MRLTEANIKKLQPPERGNCITYDDEIPGFGLRVTAANARAFVLGYSINGRKRRMSIGRWPVWTATAARARAKQLRRMIDLGQDPLGERQARRGEPTFAQVAAEYLKRHAARKKSGYRDEAWLRNDVLPEWGPLKASELRRRDVIRLIEEKAETAPIAANRLLALIRTVFNFAIDRDLLEANPAARVKPPGKEVKRDRVLNAEEIRAFWQGLEGAKMGPEMRTLLRMILITAQRPGEVTMAGWEEFDLESDWWTIPSERSKNGLAHRVPLSSLALEQLEVLQRRDRWVFASRRGGPFYRTSPANALIDNRNCFAIAHFAAHDLRRTAASHMTSVGVARLVVSKILNHVERGVTSTYDRHSYDLEKQHAMNTWDRKLRAILNGEAGKIVEFHQ